MSKRFHISPNVGAAVCSASSSERCRFGGEEDHYPTLNAAQKVFEKQMEEGNGGLPEASSKTPEKEPIAPGRGFHLNPETEKPVICREGEAACSEDNHFMTKEEAQDYNSTRKYLAKSTDASALNLIARFIKSNEENDYEAKITEEEREDLDALHSYVEDMNRSMYIAGFGDSGGAYLPVDEEGNIIPRKFAGERDDQVVTEVAVRHEIGKLARRIAVAPEGGLSFISNGKREVLYVDAMKLEGYVIRRKNQIATQERMLERRIEMYSEHLDKHGYVPAE